jgi:hypothetical protein
MLDGGGVRPVAGWEVMPAGKQAGSAEELLQKPAGEVQAVPSQCSIKVVLPVRVPAWPTAQASPAEVAATPYRSELVPAGVGLGTRVQVPPRRARA